VTERPNLPDPPFRSGTEPAFRSGTEPAFRSGTEPAFNAFTADGSLLCHGCGPAGQCRFGISDVRLDDDGTIRAATICSPAFEGAPGMAHGGWIAAVLDEITGFLTILRAGFAVTASLHVDFKRPVPLNEPLVLVAREDSSNDGRWHVHGELRHAATDALLASTDAVYVQRDERYFARPAGD
jgi:acyl-coenzyme A thioesterase PaaI-like protein